MIWKSRNYWLWIFVMLLCATTAQAQINVESFASQSTESGWGPL